MSSLNHFPILATAVFIFMIVSGISARDKWPAKPAIEQLFRHNTNLDEIIYPCLSWIPHGVGNIHVLNSNMGTFGGYNQRAFDNITGKNVYPMRYPANANHTYFYDGGILIGAVLGRETVVSCGTGPGAGMELLPPTCPRGEMKQSTANKEHRLYSEAARSDNDLIAVYADTLDPLDIFDFQIYNPVESRPHRPIGLEITERSYAWAYDYADDFIIYDYEIKNITLKTIRGIYIGIYTSPCVTHNPASEYEESDGCDDEYSGFLKTYAASYPCEGYTDSINVSYFTDNDGFPNEDGEFDGKSPRGACGIKILKMPYEGCRLNFNWWSSENMDITRDWAPRKRGTSERPFRDMNGYFGTPYGDDNLYYTMSNGEFDYDQIFAAVSHEETGYLPPPYFADDIASGKGNEAMLSFGPFYLAPGEILPFAFALVGGDNVHQGASDYAGFMNPRQPGDFYNKLNFSELVQHARWAEWVYDNPGYDTDGDGYRGESRICCVDSGVPEDYPFCEESREIYYSGDGIVDLCAAAPPPYPIVRVSGGPGDSLSGTLTLRWNGLTSETTMDPFSRRFDFEGYRVYISRGPESGGFVNVNSYDRENFDRWVWDSRYGAWLNTEIPFSLDSLKKLYGEGFNPFDYDRDNPFYSPDSDTIRGFYFAPHDWNVAGLDDPYGIHKMYHDQPYPSTLDIDSAAMYYPDELTEEGEFKYFEYEYIFRNLLRSPPYYVAVTAFDHGAPGMGLGVLETKPADNMVKAYAHSTATEAEKYGLNIIVYPNPYRVDANYRGNGFEGYGQRDMPDFRVRALHFINLPHKCTIRIFSLDGDLIREIQHDYPMNHPEAAHDIWDLITRNTQAPVSGIYYYSVESEFGNQIGKFVLIM